VLAAFLLENVPIGLPGTYETVVLVAKMELEIGTQNEIERGAEARRTRTEL